MNGAAWLTPNRALLVVALSLIAIAAPAARSRGEIAVDDVFITYRYAQNLAAGHGFVFNPGERVFGTTAPGFGLLLAGFHQATGASIPWLGTLSTALSVVVLALLVFVSARQRGRGLEAFAGGALLVSSSYFWVHSGSEIPVALALLAAAAALVERSPTGAGVLAAAAVWCRPDALLGAGVLGLLRLAETRRIPWRYGLALAVGVLAGLALAAAWFGDPLPTTLEAKRAQAELGAHFWRSGLAFWGEAYGALSTFYTGPASRFGFFALGLVGLVPLLAHGGRTGRLVGFTALVLVVAYPLLGVPFYSWYSIPVVAALAFGFTFAAGALGRRVAHFFGDTRAARAVAAGVLLVVFGATAWALALRSAQAVRFYAFEPRYKLYRETGLWLAENARPGDELAFVEVGTLAFFSRLPIHDLIGLVSPESLPYVTKGDTEGAFLAHPTSLFIGDPALGGLIQQIAEQPWFLAAYQPEHSFKSVPGRRTVTVYRQVEGAVLPAPRPPLGRLEKDQAAAAGKP